MNTKITPQQLIAVTGGIASGKSSVCYAWANLKSLATINVDHICRQLLEPHAKGWQALYDNFGTIFFNAHQQLDRQLLRETIFKEPLVRHKLDSLIHPLAKQELLSQCKQISEPQILVEVPLLFEAQWQNYFSRVVVVYLDHHKAYQRIIARDKVGATQALKGLQAQLPSFDKAIQADHVIDNRSSWMMTLLQIHHLTKILKH